MQSEMDVCSCMYVCNQFISLVHTIQFKYKIFYSTESEVTEYCTVIVIVMVINIVGHNRNNN